MKEELRKLWQEYVEYLEANGLYSGYHNFENFIMWLLQGEI
jgi:hypothetical protein